jgi:hypothetical protein
MVPNVILESLRDMNISLGGTIVAIPNIESAFFIPVSVERSGDGTSTPSKKNLIDAKSKLQDAGFIAEFLIVDAKTQDLEHSLRSSLLVSYPNIIRNAFLSREGTDADIWIDTKKVIDQQEREQISAHISEFGKLFGLTNPKLLSLDDTAVATRFETLSAIRLLAPVSCENLRDELGKRGYTVPSLDWVNRQFDLLRKSGLVTRLHDRRYVLSLEGLKRLGTVKNRRSPDIQRLLALARSRD